jgi:hypothetical protein
VIPAGPIMSEEWSPPAASPPLKFALLQATETQASRAHVRKHAGGRKIARIACTQADAAATAALGRASRETRVQFHRRKGRRAFVGSVQSAEASAAEERGQVTLVHGPELCHDVACILLRFLRHIERGGGAAGACCQQASFAI